MTLRYVDLYLELPRAGEYTNRSLHQINTVILHHTDNYLPDEAELLRRAAQYHINKGWPGIGYHYCVGTDGTIYRTQPAWKMSYHAGIYNTWSIGIVFPGNYSHRSVTEAQKKAAMFLVKRLRLICPRLTNVIGHRDVRNTQCPGDNLYAFLPELRGAIV